MVKISNLICHKIFTYNDAFGVWSLQCLPQKISQAIPNLVPGDKYILQDTNGQQWEVTLGIKDKIHWAFREGWNKFYEDHGLKTGYILAFHYTMDAPFVVEIFDRTGFEKINFPVATGKKRKTSENDGNCNAIVGECQNLSNHSSKNQGVAFSGTSDSEARTQSQPMSKDKSLSLENGNGEYQLAASANCDIEPHCMIDRYDGSKYEQDRTTVLNLANSEMQFGVELDGSTDKGTYPSNAATESDAIAGNISENLESAKVVIGDPPAEVAVTLSNSNNNITSEYVAEVFDDHHGSNPPAEVVVALSNNNNITSEYVAEVINDNHGSNQVHSESRIKSSTGSRKRVRREPARSVRQSSKFSLYLSLYFLQTKQCQAK